MEWVIVIANANACHLITWFSLICFHRFSQFLNFLTHLQPFLTNLQPLLLLIYNQFHTFLQKRKFQLFTFYGDKRVIKKPSILALFLDQKTKNQQTKRKRTLFLRSSSRNRVVYYYNSCIVKGLKKARRMCLYNEFLPEYFWNPWLIRLNKVHVSYHLIDASQALQVLSSICFVN